MKPPTVSVQKKKPCDQCLSWQVLWRRHISDCVGPQRFSLCLHKHCRLSVLVKAMQRYPDRLSIFLWRAWTQRPRTNVTFAVETATPALGLYSHKRRCSNRATWGCTYSMVNPDRRMPMMMMMMAWTRTVFCPLYKVSWKDVDVDGDWHRDWPFVRQLQARVVSVMTTLCGSFVTSKSPGSCSRDAVEGPKNGSSDGFLRCDDTLWVVCDVQWDVLGTSDDGKEMHFCVCSFQHGDFNTSAFNKNIKISRYAC